MFVAIIVSRCRFLWFHCRCGYGSEHCCCRPHYHHQSRNVIDTLALRQSRWYCVCPHIQTASSLHVYIYCQIEFLLISSYESDATRTHMLTIDARKFGKCSPYDQIYWNTKYRPTSRCCSLSLLFACHLQTLDVLPPSLALLYSSSTFGVYRINCFCLNSSGMTTVKKWR